MRDHFVSNDCLTLSCATGRKVIRKNGFGIPGHQVLKMLPVTIG